MFSTRGGSGVGVQLLLLDLVGDVSVMDSGVDSPLNFVCIPVDYAGDGIL